MSTNKEQQVINGILKFGPEILEHCVLEGDVLEKYLTRIDKEFLKYPRPKKNIDTNNWFMPQSYKDFDIRNYILSMCKTDVEVERVNIELAEYENRNLMNLLKQMKYIIDTLRKNNIVWGVGRGSSVASYVLYLMGVHRIDSIKYNIPLNEFFKGEQNG